MSLRPGGILPVVVIKCRQRLDYLRTKNWCSIGTDTDKTSCCTFISPLSLASESSISESRLIHSAVCQHGFKSSAFFQQHTLLI